MKEFSYKALTQNGQTVTGTRPAASAGDLSVALQTQNLILLSSRRTLGSFGFGFSKTGRAGKKHLSEFTQHLATCLSAGIPIVSALSDFERECPTKAFASVVADIRNEVSSGTQLSAAMEKHPDVFSEIYLALVTAGQGSGNLDRTFTELVDYLEWAEEMQAKAKQAMVYPAILGSAVLGLFLLLFLFVIPRFQGMFGELGVELPALTQKVLGTGQFFGRWWPLLLGLVVATVVGVKLLRRRESGREFIDRLLLKMPILGGFIQKVALSRFANNFVMLIGSGVDLLGVLALLERVVGNRVLATEVAAARERVMTGQTLAAAFESSENFPPLIRRLIAVGEQSGQLEVTMKKAAQFLEKELPRTMKQLFTFLEVGIITVLGATIAVAALALLLPIFQVQNQVAH